jgi:hypothetical protein
MQRRSLVTLAFAIAGCGGGDTDVAVAVGGGGGTVVVVVEDASAESSDSAAVSFDGVTLVGERAVVQLFDGRETVDLREGSTVLGVGRHVPAGDYATVELDVQGQRIELHPRGGIRVEPGETRVLQLDVDADAEAVFIDAVVPAEEP